ncbi:MAG: alkaline phosphatase [Candidatus Caldatribacteriaceae bacterium]
MKVRFGYLVLLIALVSVLFVGGVVFAAGVKYLFLFIGDGMSANSVWATEFYLYDLKAEGKTPGMERLSFTKFPVVGLMSTFDAGRCITDSASAITAMMSGKKTLDGVLNMDPEKTKSFTTLAEEAKAAGMKIGDLSTVSLNHATPAGLYAHNPSRNNYYDIALELAKSGFSYFAGGGFVQPTGKEKDKESIFDILKKEGYTVVQSREDLEKISAGQDKVVVINPVLDKDAAMPYAIDRKAEEFSLAELVRKGIELLENPQGFFMMVEGGKIDWACHANDLRTAIGDILDFDKAVAEAISFYEKHPEETLIIVTADHGTGGPSLGYAITGYNLYLRRIENQKVSYQEFEKKVKEYAQNTPPEKRSIDDFWPTIAENFGFIRVSAEEKAQLEEKAKSDPLAKEKLGMVISDYEWMWIERAFLASMSGEKLKGDENVVLYGGYDPLTVTLTHIMAEKAGIGWTTYSHTGDPVPVFAIGAGAELFSGYYDNTDLYAKMKDALGLRVETGAKSY